MHVFKERMVEVSLLHRSFQSNKQAPCTHPNVNFSGLRQFQKFQRINVIIEWLYSWIACFLDTYRNTWCHDTFFFLNLTRKLKFQHVVGACDDKFQWLITTNSNEISWMYRWLTNPRWRLVMFNKLQIRCFYKKILMVTVTGQKLTTATDLVLFPSNKKLSMYNDLKAREKKKKAEPIITSYSTPPKAYKSNRCLLLPSKTNFSMYDALKARGKKRKTERNKKRSRSSHSIPHCRKPTKATDVESTPSKINFSVYDYLKTRKKIKK